jgi:hypothetical protein
VIDTARMPHFARAVIDEGGRFAVAILGFDIG